MQLLKLKSQVRGYSLNTHAEFLQLNKRPADHIAHLRALLTINDFKNNF